MVAMLMLPGAEEEERSAVLGKLSGLVLTQVEPVGKSFSVYCSRQHNRSHSSLRLSDESESDEESSGDIEIELDEKYLRSLDPKEWKDQDHYAVLGLQSLRHEATDNQIKKAYRKVVLTHHPDKRRSAGENVAADTDNDYYTCITKAYEILGNQLKRRSYDSIDPEFDDTIPAVNANSKENFFKVFTEAFERNARWSTKRPVLQLGDMNATFSEVDAFYSIWYNFDSWREFSYLDEEEKEKGENREERRWIEKQNKSVRLKRKKEEMTRIRQLVDNAYACDPRIQKFKEEDKQKKLAYKKARQEAAKAKAEEEERVRQEALEAERKAKQKEEEETKIQLEVAKKAKEVAKKALKKERRTLRTFCKDNNYYADNDAEVVNHMAELDKVCELLSLESMEALTKSLSTTDYPGGRVAFLQQVKELNDQLAREKEELLASTQKTSTSSSNTPNNRHWSHDDIQLLIKAVNLFPAGTNQRWDVVADYMNQHSTNTAVRRKAKEVLAKAKDLNKLDPTLKEEVNKHAYNKFEKTQKLVEVKDDPAISERFESPAEQQGVNLSPWTADEQRRLEQALKTYPSSTVDRWGRISECLPGRSKKDCMKRYKDLVEMVRAKKAVQDAKVKK